MRLSSFLVTPGDHNYRPYCQTTIKRGGYCTVKKSGYCSSFIPLVNTWKDHVEIHIYIFNLQIGGQCYNIDLVNVRVQQFIGGLTLQRK